MKIIIMKNLNEGKADALMAYKAAKMVWLETVTRENMKAGIEPEVNK